MFPRKRWQTCGQRNGPAVDDRLSLTAGDCLRLVEPTGPRTALAGGFNRSMQHTKNCRNRRSVADEVPDANLLHGRPEGIDVGAMEARLDAPSDCPVVQSIPHVSAGNPFANWRLSAAGAQPLCQRWLSAKRSRALWWLASRSAQLLPCWGARRRRSVARSSAMVGGRTTGPQPQIALPGIVRCAPSNASSSRTERWRMSSPTSFGPCGRQNRSPGGSSILIRATRATTCHTRPSTAASSFKRVAP